MSGGTASGAADDQNLAGRVTLLTSIVYKRFLLLKRYPVNTAAQFLGFYLFFAVLFFGGKEAAESIGGSGAMSETFDGLIVAWFLLTMSVPSYISLATDIADESQWGTLEQLYMSPYGFGTVMASKVVANLLENLFLGSLILAMMLVTTGRALAVDLVTVGTISVLTLLSVVGFGFMFAGAAMIYKRLENITRLMQFVIIGLIGVGAAGPNALPLRLLPLVQGSGMLQEAMQNGVRLWQFDVLDLTILVSAGLIQALVGYAIFRYCTQIAKRRGVMGHY